MGSLSAARKIRCIRLGRLRWQSGAVRLLICTTVITATLVAVGFYHVYFDRTNLPDIHIAGYSIFYGSLSTVIIFVLWVYYSSTILVVGGEFAYFLEEDRQKSKA